MKSCILLRILTLYYNKSLMVLCRLTRKKKSFIFGLNHGNPMIKYTTMKNLFMQLNILNNIIKQWSNGVSWEMVNCMCKLQVL